MNETDKEKEKHPCFSCVHHYNIVFEVISRRVPTVFGFTQPHANCPMNNKNNTEHIQMIIGSMCG